MEMIFVLIICSLILWQDLRYRAVHWLLFPALCFGGLWLNGLQADWYTWLYSLLFVAFLMGTLTLYLSLKKKQLVNITNGFFSWGDIFLLVAGITFFDSANFMLFFTSGTILSLFIHIILSLFKPQTTVPYAGYLALYLPLCYWGLQYFNVITYLYQ